MLPIHSDHVLEMQTMHQSPSPSLIESPSRINQNNCEIIDVENFTELNFPGEKIRTGEYGWDEYIKITLYSCAIIASLFGNMAVVISVLLKRSLRVTVNLYLANLAVADILICVCCMWVHLVNHLTAPAYVLGPFFCKINSFAQMTCLTSSVLTLSAISCDRYMAIMYPLRSRVTKQRTGIVITLIWLVSLVISIPFYLSRRYETFKWLDYTQTTCLEDWPYTMTWTEHGCVKNHTLKTFYYTLVSTTLFFAPVLIMISAYSAIIWILWGSRLPGEHNESNLRQQKKSKRKVIKMVVVVLLVFVICWLPLQIILLYSIYFHSSAETLPSWFGNLIFYSYFVAYSNSVFNPLIYGGFNKNFRDAIYKNAVCRTICCLKGRWQHALTNTGQSTTNRLQTQASFPESIPLKMMNMKRVNAQHSHNNDKSTQHTTIDNDKSTWQTLLESLCCSHDDQHIDSDQEEDEDDDEDDDEDKDEQVNEANNSNKNEQCNTIQNYDLIDCCKICLRHNLSKLANNLTNMTCLNGTTQTNNQRDNHNHDDSLLRKGYHKSTSAPIVLDLSTSSSHCHPHHHHNQRLYCSLGDISHHHHHHHHLPQQAQQSTMQPESLKPTPIRKQSGGGERMENQDEVSVGSMSTIVSNVQQPSQHMVNYNQPQTPARQTAPNNISRAGSSEIGTGSITNNGSLRSSSLTTSASVVILMDGTGHNRGSWSYSHKCILLNDQTGSLGQGAAPSQTSQSLTTTPVMDPWRSSRRTLLAIPGHCSTSTTNKQTCQEIINEDNKQSMEAILQQVKCCHCNHSLD